MFPQHNWLCTGHRGCSRSWSPDPNFLVPSCLPLALASTPPPICRRGRLYLPSLCLLTRGVIISSSSCSSFQNHIFLEFIPAFKIISSSSCFKATFSVEFLPLCCAGPSRQDRRRAEVERGEKVELYMVKNFEVKRGGTSEVSCCLRIGWQVDQWICHGTGI